MSKRIKGITIEIDGETKGLDKALKNVNKEARDIQKELKDVDRLLKFNPKNVELLAQKKKLLAQQVDNTKKKLDQLKASQEQVTRAFERGEINEEQYRGFQRELAATEGRLNHYEQQLREADRTQRSFGERMAASGRTVQEFGKKMTSVGKEMTMKVTAPLMAVGTIATKIGMDFKAGLSEVQAISGATATEIGELEVKARELGSSTKFSAKEVSDGFKYMALAGWDVQQSLDGIDGVLNLAAASGEDLALVSDILTDAISAFGDEASDATRYADVLAATASNANTDVNMLGEAFKYVAPVAGALGYSLEDTSLALGIMANSGIKASNAGTALRGALTNMVSPTKSMAKEMKKLGINVLDSSGEMKPLDKLLGDLRGSFGKLTEAEQASSAATIFGKEAMAGMLALINASDKDFDKLSSAIENSEGVAESMARTMQDNLQGKLTNLKSALEELAIKIFDALEPALTWLLGAFQSLVDWLNGLDKNTQTAIVAIAGIVAAIGPLAIVLGTILTMVGGFMTFLPTLTPLLAGLAAPIGIVVGALLALGAAYVLLKTDADETYKSQEKLAESNLKLSEAYRESVEETSAHLDKTAELIEQTEKQIKTTDELVGSYENLTEKSKLSTDEFGEFLTLQSQLEGIKSPERIAELEGKMEALRVKSGLSKDEFNKLLESNASLVEQFPAAGAVIDEYGNKIADTTGKLRDMTAAELERMGIEVYNEMMEGLQAVNAEVDNYLGLSMQIDELTASNGQKQAEILAIQQQMTENEATRENINKSISEIKDLQKDASIKEWWALEQQKNELQGQDYVLAEQNKKNAKNLETLESTLDTQKQDLSTKKETRDAISENIDKNTQNYDLYLNMLSTQFDINLEKGKENESLDAAIKKRNEEIKQLQQKIKNEGDSNGKLDEAIKKLETENRQLGEAKDNVNEISTAIDSQNKKYDQSADEIKKSRAAQQEVGTEIDNNSTKTDTLNTKLGKSEIKEVTVNTNKDPDTENEKWSKPISKFVKFIAGKIPGLYTGTNYHTGGPAFIGEKGPELVSYGGKTQLMGFGLYDLPVGAKVQTHEESIAALRNGLVDGIGQGVNAQRRSVPSTNSGALVTGNNSELVGILTEQNRLLLQLVKKDTSVYLDGDALKNNVNDRNAVDALTKYF